MFRFSEPLRLILSSSLKNILRNCLFVVVCVGFGFAANATEGARESESCATSMAPTQTAEVAQSGVGLAEKTLAPNEMAEQVVHATKYLESLDLMQIMAFTDIYPQLFEVIALARPSLPAISSVEPIFPTDFFHRYFRNLGMEEVKAREIFSEIGKNLGNPDISSETLLILAYASRKVHVVSSNESGGSVTPMLKDKLQEKVREFLRRMNQRSRLPIFRDFFERNDQVFALFMAYLRQVSAEALGYYIVGHTKKTYVAVLVRKLGENPNLSLEEKVELALNQTEFELVDTMKNLRLLAVLTNPDKKDSRLDRWLGAGMSFLTREIFSFLEDMQFAALSRNEILFKEPNVEFARRFDASIEKDSRFLANAFLFVSERINQNYASDPLVIRKGLVDELHDLGRSLREAARQEQKAQELLAQDKSQAAGAATLHDFTPIVVKPKGARSIGIGRHTLARTRENALPSNQGELRTRSSRPAPEESLRPLPGSVPLVSLLDENVAAQSDIVYSFQFGNILETNNGSGAFHYVRFQKSFLNDLKKREVSLARWVRNFITREGFQRITGANTGSYWEVKHRSTGLRVVLKQEKQSKEWIWMDIVEHDRLDTYRIQHGL